MKFKNKEILKSSILSFQPVYRFEEKACTDDYLKLFHKKGDVKVKKSFLRKEKLFENDQYMISGSFIYGDYDTLISLGLVDKSWAEVNPFDHEIYLKPHIVVNYINKESEKLFFDSDAELDKEIKRFEEELKELL